MTRIITSLDASLSNVGFRAPVTRGLKYWGIFGGDAERTARNYAPGGTDGVVVGSPVYHDGYVEFDGGQSFVQTGVDDAEKVSIFYIGKQGTVTSYFVSNSQGPAVLDPARNSLGLSVHGSTDLRLFSAQVTAGVSSNAQIVLTPTMTDWMAVEAHASNTLRLLKNMTTGAIVNPATTARTRDLGVSKFRIGSSVSSDNGISHMAMAAIYTGVDLTTDERAAIYAKMKVLAALPYRAITI